MGEPFSNNVRVSQRMVVVGITDVELHGVLEFSDPYGMDISCWYAKDGKNMESIDKWLEAFEGKNVEIKISLLDRNDDGVSVREKVCKDD